MVTLDDQGEPAVGRSDGKWSSDDGVSSSGGRRAGGGGAGVGRRPGAAAALRSEAKRSASPVEGNQPGFTPIFDGQSLKGWEGDPAYWRVEGGAPSSVRSRRRPSSRATLSSSGAQAEPAEGLRAEARLPDHPSGTAASTIGAPASPIRSHPPTASPYAATNFDIDGPKRYIGRTTRRRAACSWPCAARSRGHPGRPPVVVASLGDEAQLATLATDDWNAVHLSVRGNTLMRFLNGHLLSMTIDDDAANRPHGLIGMQVHVGPPMKVEYRNIRLKTW